ncbi:hypothetical protein [Sinisalibacter aestuarii]|uniref:hypothetical protein n=1 Tax=Sinisalibacter aestuarii TaxID=2949426 RepID=UPI00248FBC5F|nr:hypothetical protein [Sinisalibacter aestuarii]
MSHVSGNGSGFFIFVITTSSAVITIEMGCALQRLGGTRNAGFPEIRITGNLDI